MGNTHEFSLNFSTIHIVICVSIIIVIVSFLWSLIAKLRRKLSSFSTIFSEYLMIKELARDARYLDAVYEFQTTFLSQASPAERHKISDSLSQFVRESKKDFWKKAHAATYVYGTGFGYRLQSSFRNYIEIGKGYIDEESILGNAIAGIPGVFKVKHPEFFPAEKS